MSRLRIAMLAPPWMPIPPPGYGGIEAVVNLLCRELTRRGHEVTLFAAPGSSAEAAELVHPLERPYPHDIQKCIYEADHVAAAFDRIDADADAGRPFDIVHDHSGFAAFAFANRLRTPLVHTLHGPFNEDTCDFYARNASKAPVMAISTYQAEQAPDGVRVVGVTPNPLVVTDFPFRAEKDDYLLWVGRMNDDKGAHRAIHAAKLAGADLVLAGVVQPGQEEYFAREVEPHIDGRQIRYIGEIGGRGKLEVFSRARGFLMPIRWPEPFGLVMTEAMACGTPVIAYREGSVPDVVADARTGFIVDGEEEMAEAVGRLGEIDPAACREWVAERFDLSPVTDSVVRAYRKVVEERRTATKTTRTSDGRLSRPDHTRRRAGAHDRNGAVAVDQDVAVAGGP